MKKYFFILPLFSFVQFLIIPRGALAADEPHPKSGNDHSVPSVMTPPDDRRAKDELHWREQLAAAKAQRTGLLIVGIGGAVAGVVVVANGAKEFSEAENTPGCSRDGNEILCDNEASRATAQDKLDSGRSKMLTGAVVLVIGTCLGIWGISRGSEADRLERLGKKKKYTVDVAPQGRDGASILFSRSF